MEAKFKKELEELERNGLKANPLRLEYEEKVRGLSCLKEQLLQSGCSVEQAARFLHGRRRELGEQYKNAASPLFREYIFYVTEKKYGDPLGPDYETLRKQKSAGQIVESATRPIRDLDDRLTIAGFIRWYHEIYQK